MKIRKATRRYEAWLREQIVVVDEDLRRKHALMAADPFPFLRATCYRWAQRFPRRCAHLLDAPVVLSVGDLHVENFGTWRDGEGRLVWGINDFDEAWPLPYAQDLVRLATSVELAARQGQLVTRVSAACDAILAGYSEAMEAGGAPFVLGEHHPWLRELAITKLRDPARYWAKLDALPRLPGQIPDAAADAIARLLPSRDLELKTGHRVAGLGSLGRQRYVVVAQWCGGRIAREAKAAAPSAWSFAATTGAAGVDGVGGGKGAPAGAAEKGAGDGGKGGASWFDQIVSRAVRAPDPYLALRRGWVVRRLSPDCARIELGDLPERRDEARVLRAMGWETANVHLGTDGARKAVRRDLLRRPAGWLHEAAEGMLEAVLRDHAAWRDHHAGDADDPPSPPAPPPTSAPL